MKVAIPYENGNIFEHFGKAKQFKIYEITDGAITSSEVVDIEGEGHDAVAKSLNDLGVQVVACGNIGAGAQDALELFGIVAFSGAKGEADKVIENFLVGDVPNEGANCNCDGGCGGEGGCGGSCGSCGGGCGGCGGAPRILFEGPNAGKVCSVHYKGTFNDGTVFDSSYDRGEPIQFVCGVGMMIKGFDKAVATMKVGEKVDIHLAPEEAYGPVNPNAIIELPIASLPGSEELTVGEQVVLTNGSGRQFPVKVIAKTDDMIRLDANHEMAGKELNFSIELVEVTEG